MALTVTHAKVDSIADDPVAAAAGYVLPSDWNANHTVTGTLAASSVTGLATVATTGAYSDLTGTPSAVSGANPTASIGLTAVNGSAATFMRSDAAPTIDQTAAWVFSGLGITTVNKNTAAAPTKLSTTVLQLVGADASGPTIQMDSFGSTSNLDLRSAAGTGASPTAVTSGNVVGNVVFSPYYTNGGPGYADAFAAISAQTQENITSTNRGSAILIRTTPVGSQTLATVGIWGATTPVGSLRLTGAGINGGGGLQVDTGITAKTTVQALSAGGSLISYFGCNVYADGSLTSQRYDTSLPSWAFSLDARSATNQFRIQSITSGGTITYPFVVTGNDTVGIGNNIGVGDLNLTGASLIIGSAGTIQINGMATMSVVRWSVVDKIKPDGTAAMRVHCAKRLKLRFGCGATICTD